MDESAWLAGDNWAEMLVWYAPRRFPGYRRKVQLFVLAILRGLWACLTDAERQAVWLGEQRVDGLITDDDLIRETGLLPIQERTLSRVCHNFTGWLGTDATGDEVWESAANAIDHIVLDQTISFD